METVGIVDSGFSFGSSLHMHAICTRDHETMTGGQVQCGGEAAVSHQEGALQM